MLLVLQQQCMTDMLVKMCFLTVAWLHAKEGSDGISSWKRSCQNFLSHKTVLCDKFILISLYSNEIFWNVIGNLFLFLCKMLHKVTMFTPPFFPRGEIPFTTTILQTPFYIKQTIFNCLKWRSSFILLRVSLSWLRPW